MVNAINPIAYNMLRKNIITFNIRGKYLFCSIAIFSFNDIPNIDVRLRLNDCDILFWVGVIAFLMSIFKNQIEENLGLDLSAVSGSHWKTQCV